MVHVYLRFRRHGVKQPILPSPSAAPCCPILVVFLHSATVTRCPRRTPLHFNRSRPQTSGIMMATIAWTIGLNPRGKDGKGP